jgi:hypothetical protein
LSGRIWKRFYFRWTCQPEWKASREHLREGNSVCWIQWHGCC